MLTFLALTLIGVLATAIVIASTYFFLRARRREEAAPDPSDAIVEMRALGQRIETLVGQQQLQGETARHQLAQKMDAVGQTVDQQRHHLSGLQNELRHEVRRRDAEMEDIRTQLASIQQTPRLDGPPALALPEAPAATPVAETFEVPTPVAPESTAPATPEVPVTFETPTFETPAFETLALPSFQTGDGIAATDDGWDVGPAAPPVFSDPFAETPPSGAPPALPVFETVAPFTEPDPFAGPEAAPESDFEPFDFEPPADIEPVAPSMSFAAPSTITFEDITPSALSVQAPQAAPAIAPPSQTAWVSLAGRSAAAPDMLAFQTPVFEAIAVDAPAVETLQAPAFQAPALQTPSVEAEVAAAPGFETPTFETPVPAGPPAGADRLTRIGSIDEEMETALYAAGVTTLDEIARWGRSDARRIAAEVAASEDTIMNQWVFEAQAALFQSFAIAQQGR